MNYINSIDKRIKEDNFLGVSALEDEDLISLERENRSPLALCSSFQPFKDVYRAFTTPIWEPSAWYSAIFNWVVVKPLKYLVVLPVTMIIYPLVVHRTLRTIVGTTLYHVAALVGAVFCLFIQPIIILCNLGCNKKGFKEAFRVTLENVCDILTNINQIARSALGAIPLVGGFASYAFDFVEVAILKCPVILPLAQKIDNFIHLEEHGKVRSPILQDDAYSEHVAFGVHSNKNNSQDFRNTIFDSISTRYQIACDIAKERHLSLLFSWHLSSMSEGQIDNYLK